MIAGVFLYIFIFQWIGYWAIPIIFIDLFLYTAFSAWKIYFLIEHFLEDKFQQKINNDSEQHT